MVVRPCRPIIVHGPSSSLMGRLRNYDVVLSSLNTSNLVCSPYRTQNGILIHDLQVHAQTYPSVYLVISAVDGLASGALMMLGPKSCTPVGPAAWTSKGLCVSAVEARVYACLPSLAAHSIPIGFRTFFLIVSFATCPPFCNATAPTIAYMVVATTLSTPEVLKSRIWHTFSIKSYNHVSRSNIPVSASTVHIPSNPPSPPRCPTSSPQAPAPSSKY